MNRPEPIFDLVLGALIVGFALTLCAFVALLVVGGLFGIVRGFA